MTPNDFGLASLAVAVSNSPLVASVCVCSALQSRKASETDKEKKGLEGRADSIGSGRAIPIKQVSISLSLPLPLSVFDVLALISSEITHLTSIRVRGSPGSCKRIIRSREAADLPATPPTTPFSQPLFFFLFFLPPSVQPLQASLCSKTLFCHLEAFDWSTGRSVFAGMKRQEEEAEDKGEEEQTSVLTPAAMASRAPERAPHSS